MIKRIILFLSFMFIIFTLNAQSEGGFGFRRFATYANMTATTVNNSDKNASRRAYVHSTGLYYIWDGVKWIEEKDIATIGGTGAPMYTPTTSQPYIVLNGVGDIYTWDGVQWNLYQASYLGKQGITVTSDSILLGANSASGSPIYSTRYLNFADATKSIILKGNRSNDDLSNAPYLKIENKMQSGDPFGARMTFVDSVGSSLVGKLDIGSYDGGSFIYSNNRLLLAADTFEWAIGRLTAPNVIDSTHVKPGGLRGTDLNSMGASSGQALIWNGTTWYPGNVVSDSTTVYTLGILNPVPSQYQRSGNFYRKTVSAGTYPDQIMGISDGSNWIDLGFRLDTNRIKTEYIKDNAVTADKVQDITGTRLLGRYSGSNGSFQEIKLGNNLSFSNDTLNTIAGNVLANQGLALSGDTVQLGHVTSTFDTEIDSFDTDIYGRRTVANSFSNGYSIQVYNDGWNGSPYSIYTAEDSLGLIDVFNNGWATGQNSSFLNFYPWQILMRTTTGTNGRSQIFTANGSTSMWLSDGAGKFNQINEDASGVNISTTNGVNGVTLVQGYDSISVTDRISYTSNIASTFTANSLITKQFMENYIDTVSGIGTNIYNSDGHIPVGAFRLVDFDSTSGMQFRYAQGSPAIDIYGGSTTATYTDGTVGLFAPDGFTNVYLENGSIQIRAVSTPVTTALSSTQYTIDSAYTFATNLSGTSYVSVEPSEIALRSLNNNTAIYVRGNSSLLFRWLGGQDLRNNTEAKTTLGANKNWRVVYDATNGGANAFFANASSGQTVVSSPSGDAQVIATDANMQISGDSISLSTLSTNTKTPMIVGINSNGYLNKMAGTSNGQVLTWQGGSWQAITPTSSGVIANNGLSLAGDTVQLGGTLVKNTTITNSSFTLSITNDIFVRGLRLGNGLASSTSNTAFGLEAVDASTSATNATGIGKYALTDLTSGSDNTAIGAFAAWKITTGGSNTVIGSGAMTTGSAVTGSNNTVVGKDAMNNLTSAAANTILGASSGQNISTGNNNILIGYQAGNFHADGTTALTTPSTSIYIGYQARGFNDSDNNTIVIGANAVGLGANTTVIGKSATTLTQLYGAQKWPAYGSGTNTGTVAYILATDASGNIIEKTTSSIGDNWGTQAVVKDSSLVNWGTTANPLGIRGYSAATNGQVPSKATGGITWITPISGSGSANQLTYWTSSTAQSGNSAFTISTSTATLTVAGTIATNKINEKYETVTTNSSTISGSYSVVYCDVNTSGSALTLPLDANVVDGDYLTIFNLNANALDINRNGTNQSINGANSVIDIPQYGHITLHAKVSGATILWTRHE